MFQLFDDSHWTSASRYDRKIQRKRRLLRFSLFCQSRCELLFEIQMSLLKKFECIHFFSFQRLFAENKEKLIAQALQSLVQIGENNKENNTNSSAADLEGQFHAIRRLGASKVGFGAFTTMTGLVFVTINIKRSLIISLTFSFSIFQIQRSARFESSSRLEER